MKGRVKFIVVAIMAILVASVPGVQSVGAKANASIGGVTVVPQGGVPLSALGTSFTYQGQLMQSSSPANGQFDFQFGLYDALSGGTQVGTTQTLSNVTVSGGLFTVSLDFGTNAFQGDSRWLDIAVRSAGGGAYTPLTPRQALTPSPAAETLRPGAVISGTIASDMLTLNNSGSGWALSATSAGAYSTLR